MVSSLAPIAEVEEFLSNFVIIMVRRGSSTAWDAALNNETCPK